MPRKLSESQIQRRDRLIREYVAKGYSANRIQKELQKQGLGIQRKLLLAEVRSVKGVSKRGRGVAYVPKKYAVRVKWRRRALGKQIAVYGTVHGKSRRIELVGSGRELYRAMRYVARHPPRERFVQASASEAPRFLDYSEEWDDHPAVES